MRRFNKYFQHLEDRPYHPAFLLFVVLVVGVGRAAQEIYLGHAGLHLRIVSEYAAFYLAVFSGFTGVAAFWLRQSWEKTAQVLIFGIFVGFLPPLLDVFWLGPGNFHYSYLDRFHLSLHGAGNPPSEALTAWTALLAFAVYVYGRCGSLPRTSLALAMAYGWLVLTVGVYPDVLKTILRSIPESFTRTFSYLLAAYVLYVAFHFRRFQVSLKRLHHSLPWVCLVFLGASLAGKIGERTWLQAVLVLFVHQGIVFANDYYDRESDALNQRTTLLEGPDIFMVQALIVWIALHTCLVQPQIGVLYVLYLLFTAAYHHPLLRLKRLFPMNYAIEGLVAALALLIGMTSTGRFDFNGLELSYAGLTFFGFAAASPFKDYKDIPGDRRTGTRTLYVLLLDRGWSLNRAHAWISASVPAFMAGALAVLRLKGVPVLWVGLIAAGFVVPAFLSLRHKKKTLAVALTIWLLIGYLSASALALHFAPMQGPK